MRAEQLYEAIGGVDSRFLFESERRRKGTKGFFAALVAVLLTAVILFGVLSFVLIALRKSDVVDPFSQFNFGLGAQTPAKEPFGIEDTVTSEHGSLYYKAEGDHSVTLVLEKTTDKNLQVYMRFSRSYIKNEDESHTEYGHDRVIFTTDPIVRALNEKATNEGVRIFVNGELCEKLPEKKGKYEIVLDYGELFSSDYELDIFRLSSFEQMEYYGEQPSLNGHTSCTLRYCHGDDERGRPYFTFVIDVWRWEEDVRNTVEQLYISCETLPLDEVTYCGKPLEKRQINGKDYFLLDFSGKDVLHSLNIYLLFYFEEDAMLAENQWIRLHFPIYLNGTEEEDLHNLYLFTQYEPNFPDEQVEYYSALEDLPAGVLYAVPTVFPDTTGEVLDIYHYPARQLTEISYCFPDDRYFSATCRVTAGGELTVSKEQSMVHNGVTFYYEFGESGSEFKPLTVGFYLKGRDAVGDRTVACTVYLEMNRYIEPELFIKGIRIMES